MEKSLQKLENDLKETHREKDKALLELNRLKQHLLEKVISPSYLFIVIIFKIFLCIIELVIFCMIKRKRERNFISMQKDNYDALCLYELVSNIFRISSSYALSIYFSFI